MNFKMVIIPDKEYYEESYSEIISSLKYKKYEPFLAVIMIGLGIHLYFMDTYNVTGIFPFFFSLMGLYELYKIYYEKKKWLKERLDSKILNEQIEMEFSDEIIKHNGPFSNGEIKWDGLKKIVKTKKGVLIKPENGVSIYLPDKLFSDKEQIEFILSKERKNT